VYESFYGFNAAPFRISPDPSFFFDSPGHRKALSYLRYGLSQKEGFIVVTGVPGTGKTTLARLLLQEIGDDRIVVSEINTTHLGADDVLRMVAASFGLEHENMAKSSLLKRLETFFLARFRAGYHLLLMVDEAQNLPKSSLEELRMLSNFYSGSHALLQIFLLGQDQFKTVLYSQDMEQLRQRVVAACHLNAFTLTETQEYIVHRLKHVGWEGNPAFHPSVFEKIQGLTRGIPRRINTFCDRLLLYASIEQLDEVTVKHVMAVANELMYELGTDEEVLAVLETELPPNSDDIEDEDVNLSKNELSVVKPVQQNAQNGTDLALVESGANAPRVKHNVANVVEKMQLSASSPPEWVEVAELALEYANHPEKYPEIKDATYPLPTAIIDLFESLAHKRGIPASVTSVPLQGIALKDLASAVRQLANATMLSNKSDYYQRLGLAHDASQEQVKHHYSVIFKLYQPVEGLTTKWDETYTRRINEAYSTLRDAQKRKAYDSFLAALANRDKNKQQNNRMLVIRHSSQSIDNSVVDETVSIDLDRVADKSMNKLVPIESELGQRKTTKKRAWIIGSITVVFVIIGVLAMTPNHVVSSYVEEFIDKITLLLPTSDTEIVEEKIGEQMEREEASPATPLDAQQSTGDALVDKPDLNVAAGSQDIPARRKITDIYPDELEWLLIKFAKAYGLGDLEAFMSTFSADASTNDQSTKSGIRDDYKSFFESTLTRIIEFKDINWDMKLSSKAKGVGDFQVTIIKQEGAFSRKFSGEITLLVEKTDNVVLITDMQHSYIKEGE